MVIGISIALLIIFALPAIFAYYQKCKKRYVLLMLIFLLVGFFGMLELFNIYNSHILNRESWHIVCFFIGTGYFMMINFFWLNMYKSKIMFIIISIVIYIAAIFLSLDSELSWGIIFNIANSYPHVRYDLLGVFYL